MRNPNEVSHVRKRGVGRILHQVCRRAADPSPADGMPELAAFLTTHFLPHPVKHVTASSRQPGTDAWREQTCLTHAAALFGWARQTLSLATGL